MSVLIFDERAVVLFETISTEHVFALFKHLHLGILVFSVGVVVTVADAAGECVFRLIRLIYII